MPAEAAILDSLLRGPLWSAAHPCLLVVRARLRDLRPRFLPKGRVGHSYRAISRNGRVLLTSDLPLSELAGVLASLRMQTWHKVILPGDLAEPYGILLCIRTLQQGSAEYTVELGELSEKAGDLAVDVGGGQHLVFQRAAG